MVGSILRKTLGLAFLLSISLYADDRGETLEKLLAELRQLREVNRQEEIQARSEFQHLNRMIRQKEVELTERTSNRDAFRGQVETRAEQVKAEAAKNSILAKQTSDLRQSLKTLLTALDSAQKENPLLLDDAGKKRLADTLATIDSAPVHDLTSQCVALMLSMGAAPTTCQMSQGTIQISNQELHVSQLRIGTLAVLWMTRDRVRCGFGAPSKDGMAWQELPASECEAIQNAIAVAKEDQPAEVLLLPLPGRVAP